MLDYASEDIDGMDDDAGAEPGQNPPITRHWTATSTYDVYMVDTPEKKDDDSTQDPNLSRRRLGAPFISDIVLHTVDVFGGVI